VVYPGVDHVVIPLSTRDRHGKEMAANEIGFVAFCMFSICHWIHVGLNKHLCIYACMHACLLLTVMLSLWFEWRAVDSWDEIMERDGEKLFGSAFGTDGLRWGRSRGEG
jgi:hypothetical protein